MKNLVKQLRKYKIKQDLNNLNQIFLIDEKIIKNIIDASDLSKKDIVLEIGAGTGNLTRALSKKVKKVIAIEIDTQFNPLLKKISKNTDVIFDDAKNYLKKSIKKNKIEFNKIVSSPPYNLCEPLLYLLNRIKNIELVILVTPRGFYEKIIQNPVFSAFLDFKKIKNISKESFYPIPRIDSEIIKITPKPFYEKSKDECSFIIRSLNIQKNKKLKNALRVTIVGLYKLKYNKLLTKNQSRKIVKSLNFNNKLLETDISAINPKNYKNISDKLLEVIKKE